MHGESVHCPSAGHVPLSLLLLAALELRCCQETHTVRQKGARGTLRAGEAHLAHLSMEPSASLYTLS